MVQWKQANTILSINITSTMFQPNMLYKIMIFKNSQIWYLFNTEWNTGKKRDFYEQVIKWAQARGVD
jgi:hypothetical protein